MTDHVARYHRYIEAFNERRWDDVEALLDPDIVDHHLPPEVPTGAGGVVHWLQLLADTMTIRVDIEQVVDAGDLVAGRGWISGTHVGDFPGMPATGRDFRVMITTVERFAEGRVTERWEVFDLDTMVAQLVG
jgi:steroid delta-isomerase-like uncharacterized protein